MISRLTTSLLAAGLASALLCPTVRLDAQGGVVASVPTTSDRNALDDVLARPVTVDVTRVPLKRAIDAAATSAGVPVQYDAHTIDAYRAPVTVHVKHVALRAALDQMLAGTSLTVVADGARRLTIVEGDTTVGLGSVSGTVSNGKTRQPIAGAAVWLDDSTNATRTDDTGHFRFANVTPGMHHVVIRALGFSRQTRVVTVVAGQAALITVALDASVNTLDQVVVTATGAQRVRELGHVVARINVDSLVREAPITSVSELLQSRVPGLQVLTGNGGMAGGEVSLRLRGTSTYQLDPEPIVIVDGIRYKSNNLVQTGATMREDRRGNGTAELQSPLNDLNPNDIETIEVVKGPSASTLYGPDAANGVILITTKRGTPGKVRFQWYARPVANDVPKTPVDKAYRAWGHDDTGALYGGNCTLMNQYLDHACTMDSVTVTTATVSDDQYSVIAKSRPTWQYGGNLSGGSQAFRYFVGANYDSQVGVLQIPPAARTVLEQQFGVSSLADAIKNPNTLQIASLHSSVSNDITSNSTVNATLNYSRTNHRMIDASVYATQAQYGTPQPGQDTTNLNVYLDPTFSLLTTEEQSNHVTGAVDGTAHFFSWLTASATLGLDLDGSVTHAILPSDIQYQGSLGYAIDDRRDNTLGTFHFGATAMARRSILSFRSSAGVDYAYAHLDGLRSGGYGLAPGSTSIATAATKTVDQLWSETASLGTYGEEVVGFRDRLFLTGSLRLDGSSTFGDAYKAHPYPKVGVSWIASDEPWLSGTPGLRELRFRASFGAASRYPTSEMKLGRVDGFGTTVQGSAQNIFDRGELANPYIRPERTREAEYGVDATLFSGIELQLTWYNRRTSDQLQPFGNNNSGLPQYWANIASLKSHGFEATAMIPVFSAVWARGDVAFAYSNRVEAVTSLGVGVDNKSYDGSGYAVGYPIGSAFGYPILGVADTVGGVADGIVLPQEVIRDSVLRFLGVVNPPRTFTATPTLTLANGRVRVSSTFDRETGFLRYNGYGSPLDAFLPTTPLLRQARYARQYNGEDFLEPGDFTRWREMNVTFELPTQLLRLDRLHLGFSRAAVSLQGRNLALWTKYHGTDPESRDEIGTANSLSDGIPQARTWSVRFDITP